MAQYDGKEKREPEGWRSSEGRMWEAAPVPRKEGRDHLTGYEPHPQERDAKPRESARMSGSYGDIAVGISRKKELTMAVSKRRSREGPAATEDEKILKGGSAVTMNLAQGKFLVNARDGEASAVAYRESYKKPPAHLLARFKEVMRNHGQDTLDEQAPFLDQGPEREELRQLQIRSEDLQAQGSHGNGYALREIEARKQELRQILTEKESQENRLCLLLQKAYERYRLQAGEAALVHSFADPFLADGDDLPPEDDGQEGEEEKLEEGDD